MEREKVLWGKRKRPITPIEKFLRGVIVLMFLSLSVMLWAYLRLPSKLHHVMHHEGFRVWDKAYSVGDLVYEPSLERGVSVLDNDQKRVPLNPEGSCTELLVLRFNFQLKHEYQKLIKNGLEPLKQGSVVSYHVFPREVVVNKYCIPQEGSSKTALSYWEPLFLLGVKPVVEDVLRQQQREDKK